MMRVWIDADACPKPIKEMLFKAAIRTKITFILVANQPLSSPSSPFIQKIQVSANFDAADHKILENMQAGDLVVTADILLADAVINKQGLALNPRGKLYTPQNMKQHLSNRNFNADLRNSGIIINNPKALSKKEIQDFINNLDKILTAYKNKDIL